MVAQTNIASELILRDPLASGQEDTLYSLQEPPGGESCDIAEKKYKVAAVRTTPTSTPAAPAAHTSVLGGKDSLLSLSPLTVE